DVVSTTTGIRRRDSSALISSNTSRPSLRGRFRSSRIMSGRTALAKGPSRRRYARASTPSLTTFNVFAILLSLSATCVSRMSPRLYSSTKISSDIIQGYLPHFRREREIERCPFSHFRFHPPPSIMPLDNLLASCQADAGAGILIASVQPLE